MSLVKRTYIDQQTVITADNLNDIQDEIIANGTAIGGKVDKVTGKQLSTEDYTTAEKTKLAGIEAQANKTVIDSTLTQTGQAADAKAAGDAVSELRNTLNSEIATRQTYVRPNLLDNWYFGNPVNQRGQSSYSNTGSYTIDRWKLTSGSVEVVSGGITLNGTLVQILEASIGQTVTTSALLSDGSMITPTYNDNTKTFTLTATGQTIKAVKLELGSDQTLAHNEGTDANPVWVLNEIPNYVEEFVKCQRYQQVITANNTVLIGRVQSDTSKIFISIPLTVTPRANGIFTNQSAFFVIGVGKRGTAAINAGTYVSASNQSATIPDVPLYISDANENELYTVIPTSDIILDFNL